MTAPRSASSPADLMPLDLVERAIITAVRAHAGQRRKDSAAPYVVHPVEVLKRAADLGIDDPELLAAAALHDAVEDTQVTLEEVRRDFGPRVAQLVDDLSFEPDKDGTKDEYMAAFAERAIESLVLKLLDRAANVDDYLRTRPAYAPAYAAKAADVYDAIERRLAEIRAVFGAPLAARAAEEVERLRQLFVTDSAAKSGRGPDGPGVGAGE